MNRSLFAAMFLGLAMVVPVPTLAQVNITITVPPPVVFAAPPEVVVIPETYVYVVPDIEEDIFFYDGWWWRPWQGRWYRSRDYSSGWVYYQSVPSFYARIPSGWRNDYREHRWGGHHWEHHRIPYQQLHHNWKGWQKSRHWEKHNTWGVEGLKTRPHSGEVRRSREAKPRPDDTVKSREYREGKPQSDERAKSRKYREAKPRPDDTVKSRKSPEGKPQSDERVKSRKYREGKPGHDDTVKSHRYREGKPQSHEADPQSHEPKPHGKPE